MDPKDNTFWGSAMWQGKSRCHNICNENKRLFINVIACHTSFSYMPFKKGRIEIGVKFRVKMFFLDALASLVLMIDNDGFADWNLMVLYLIIEIETPYQSVNQNRMSLKMECHSKFNVTQNEMSLKWNVTQNGMSLKIKCH